MEKHDAMWGAEAGGYIATLQDKNAKLRAALESIAYTDTLPGITLTREQMKELAHNALSG